MVLQPVARWNLPPHLDISGFYSAGIVAFHKDGIQQAVFGFNGTGIAIPITGWGQNPQSGSWEYFLTIPPGIPDGNYFLASAALGNDGSVRQLPNLPVNLWATVPTYTDFYVNADTGNNGNPGTSGSPFLTLRFALEALAGAGNGGRIYLQNATNPYGVTGITTVPVTTTRYLNIELAPGGSKASVSLTAWPAAGLGTSKIRFKGITIKTALTGTANDTLLLDDCHLQGTGSGVAIGATGWTPGWGSRYFVDGEVSTCLNGLFAFDMVRGATLTDIGGSALQSCAYVIDSTSTTSGAGITMISVGAQDNVLCFNVACHDCLVGMELHPALAVTLSNSAFVNVVADATQASQIRDYGLDHVLFFNCTFPGHTFTIRTNQFANSVFRQNVFRTLEDGAGDILGPPTLAQLNPIFTDTHYIAPGVTPFTPGTQVTTGSAGFTDEGANDFTPAAGSDLYDLHTAPKLAPCDAEKVARDTPTSVGALRGADEGSGAGTQEPSGLDYNPAAEGILQVVGTTGAPISPITPTWLGTITDFTVEPSIYHVYKAPPEIPCTADMAHFEVRAWEPGDPTDSTISGGHHICVVVDLRFGHIYLRNPKIAGSEPFSAMATAMNLCAPRAADAGSYTNSLGPFAIPNGPIGERPTIRYRGQYLTGLFESSGLNLSEAVNIGAQPDGGSHPNRSVFWAGQPGIGGFYPIQGSSSSGPIGAGQQIRLSVIGATGNKFDRTIGPTTMGYGFKNSGVADPTWAPIDILFKDMTFSCNFQGFVAGNFQGCFQTPDKQGKTGRLRLYDYGFNVINPPLSFDYGVKTWVEVDGGAHFDFRRGVYPAALEHANYLQGLNAGLLRDATAASGETADSWFIDLVLPNGTNRCLFHMVDRPWDQIVQGGTTGGCWIPSPSHKCRPGGKGIALFERCRVLQGSENEQGSLFNMVTGADITFILRDNEIRMQAPLGKGSAIPLPGGGVKTVQIHERGILAYNENGASTTQVCGGFGAGGLSCRINENGFNTRRIVIIGHKDYVEQPNEKRMSFRGVEEVHIYSFDLQCPLGQAKPAIELDMHSDSQPFEPYWQEPLHYQFDLEGNLVYSVAPAFGSPISNTGGFYPHSGSVFLYMGYPAVPADYSGWTPGATKMMGYIWPSTTLFDPFTPQQVNVRAGVPIELPTGITLNHSTGVISGTPTVGIGKGFLGEIFGTEIDSPFTYTAGAPAYANIPIKGANSSRGDAWDGDGIQMIIVPSGPGDIFPVPVPSERRWAFDLITVIIDINIVTTAANRRWTFDQIAVEDTGGPDIVVPPESVTSWWFDPPLVGAGSTITPATAETRWAFDQLTSGSMLGDEDGEGVGSGCEDGEGV